MDPGEEIAMRALDKAISGGHDTVLFGMRVSGSDWNTVLDRAAAQASSRAVPATLGFLDDRKLLGSLLTSARADAPASSLLLPSGRGCIRFLLRAIGGQQAVTTRFSAATFIPALLTYLGERHRIGIVGDDAGRRDGLCAHFTRHTPWHDMVALASNARPAGRFDLLIVDAASSPAQRRIAGELAGLDVGLIIMAGDGLSGFLDRRRISSGAGQKFAKPASA